MLTAPISVLSDDVLAYIVEFLQSDLETLRNLSLCDRTFTRLCQKYIFRILTFCSGSKTNVRISQKLEKITNILKDKPLLANRVRVVRVSIFHKRNAWLFADSTTPSLISLFSLLAESSIPPYELHFGGISFGHLTIEDPILMTGRLMESFFSQSLTSLHLNDCDNIPLTAFLICPKLREVNLDFVGVAECDKYPDEHCIGRESPALEIFNYRQSQALVKQMITPPSRFHTPVVLWSKLRTLTLSPHEKEEMACLQPILNAACNTLEELYLTSLKVGKTRQHSLAKRMNLSGLSQLRVFALYVIIKCNAQESAVLRDINIVLDTIPASNKITNLSFDFNIFGRHPFAGCLDEDWVGICNEVIRISAGKPLELEFQLVVDTGDLELHIPGEEGLYAQIAEQTASLADYPKICTHLWNPTYWVNGVGPFPPGRARSMCGR